MPVIASNNSAIPEVLGTDFPGLARTGDVKSFLEIMNRFVEIENRKHVLEVQDERLGIFQADLMCSRISNVYQLAL